MEIFFRGQGGLAESVGEWAFYAAVVLIVLALAKRFPYRLFFLIKGIGDYTACLPELLRVGDLDITPSIARMKALAVASDSRFKQDRPAD
ncbi:hypothetical protein [Thauera sp. WH-1]|uniref:hypothetical protein n=1 Tax=Thauera sp. WH-1 TaxID=3398230 RepID=UPI0039FBDE4A